MLDAMRLGVGTMIAAVAAGGAYLLAQAAPADRAVTSCEALPARIAAAGSGDVHRIDLPRGARCTMPPLVIAGATNLVIDGHGSTLVFSRVDRPAIRITRASRDVTLANLAIDYDPLPFTQARIEAIDGLDVRFRIEDGYPSLASLGTADRAFAFDPVTRVLKHGAPVLYSREIRGAGREGSIRLNRNSIRAVTVGDLLAVAPRRSPAIQIDGLASGTRLSNVDILASPGIAVFARFVGGDNDFKVRITRGPRPTGARTDRLVSANADGINYAYARRGPVIHDSWIGFQLDDGINLHGYMLAVVDRAGPRQLIAARPYRASAALLGIMRPGDPVRALAPGDYGVVSTVRLASIEEIRPLPRIDRALLARLYPRGRVEDASTWSVYRITLDAPVPDNVRFLDFPATAAPNFRITGNVFRDSRGRAMVIGAPHGTISDNDIAGVSQNGILLGPHYALWREAGWVHDIVVSRNRVRDSCYEPAMLSGTDAWAWGAITLAGGIERDASPPSAGNSDVRIVDNQVRGCAGAGLFIEASANVTLRGNELGETGERPAQARGTLRRPGVLLGGQVRNLSAPR